jgi:hypothetical protein
MDIIRESTTAGLMDYWTERAPTIFREGSMERSLTAKYGAGALDRDSGEKRVEWVAVTAEK